MSRLISKLPLGRWLAGIAIAILIGGAIGTIKVLQFHALGIAAAEQQTPPTPVNVEEVRPHELQRRLSAVGSVAAVEGTTVSTEAEGVVRAIEFEPGAMVQAGAALLRLDDAVEQAQLRSAEADAVLAQQSLQRARKLIEQHNISVADVDAAEAQKKRADAQVDDIRAVIAKKVVRAPFSGRLGIQRVSVGEYLHQGSPVVSLQSLDPVYVEFSAPQERIGDLREGLRVVVSADAYPQRTFEGAVTALEPEVDPETRNVRVQATLSNADHRLRPGMFVKVDALLAGSHPVLAIPAAAVVHSSHGDSVYVVDAADAHGGEFVVREQTVRLGARRGDFVVALDGVEDGDKVVSAGAFKLRPGMPVVIDNTLAPQFSFNPTPDNS